MTTPSKIRCERCGYRRRPPIFPHYPEVLICRTCLGICKSCGSQQDPTVATLSPHDHCNECSEKTTKQRSRFAQQEQAQLSPVHWSLAKMRIRGRLFHVYDTPIWTPTECANMLAFCKKKKHPFEWEIINFGPQLSHRYQRTLWMNWDDDLSKIQRRRACLPTCLQQFIKHIEEALPETCFITVKTLRSTEQTTLAQNPHADDPMLSAYRDNNKRRHIKYAQASYSFVIALEANTRVVAGTTDYEHHLTPGTFIMMRGDYIHAGVAYSTSNYRVFIATGTELFWNEGSHVDEVIESSATLSNP